MAHGGGEGDDEAGGVSAGSGVVPEAESGLELEEGAGEAEAEAEGGAGEAGGAGAADAVDDEDAGVAFEAGEADVDVAFAVFEGVGEEDVEDLFEVMGVGVGLGLAGEEAAEAAVFVFGEDVEVA